MHLVNFNCKTTYETAIKILDEDGDEVKNLKLFTYIIDSMGFALDHESTYEVDYHNSTYTVIVKKIREETTYIGYEVH